jgi:hypothetical protein
VLFAISFYLQVGCCTSQSTTGKLSFRWRLDNVHEHMKHYYLCSQGLHYVMYTVLLAQNHTKKHATNMKSTGRASHTTQSARCYFRSCSPHAHAHYRNYRDSSCCFWLHTSCAAQQSVFPLDHSRVLLLLRLLLLCTTTGAVSISAVAACKHREHHVSEASITHSSHCSILHEASHLIGLEGK